jgi:hypothetical protein
MTIVELVHPNPVYRPDEVPGGKSSDPGRRAKINDSQFVDFQEDIHQFARVKLEGVDDLREFPVVGHQIGE